MSVFARIPFPQIFSAYNLEALSDEPRKLYCSSLTKFAFSVFFVPEKFSLDMYNRHLFDLPGQFWHNHCGKNQSYILVEENFRIFPANMVLLGEKLSFLDISISKLALSSTQILVQVSRNSDSVNW